LEIIRIYDLANKIGNYIFFDYEVNEALFLSDREKEHIRNIGKGILSEYESPIDSHSQDAIVNFIDLLLVYSQRFRHLNLEERWLQANIKFIKAFRISSKIKF